jgi:hypothetical protein
MIIAPIVCCAIPCTQASQWWMSEKRTVKGTGMLNFLRPAIVSAAALLASAVSFLPQAAFAQDANTPIQLTLQNSFIETYKDRVTISDIDFTVDQVHSHPNRASQDGDLHAAGRSDPVGLPFVAEIMNARDEPALVKRLNDLQGSSQTIKLTGVWRIWPEHGGISPQVQGADVQPATTTNPPHLFEVHPITQLGNVDVRDTLHGIDGYKYKDASDAFQRYEAVAFELDCASKTTTLHTKMVGFNYVDFAIQLSEDPTHVVADGVSVLASILAGDDGDQLVYKRRIWFVKDSEPYTKVMTMHTGDQLHVLGIPRVDLSLVSWRCKQAKTRPEVRTWNLPYEMVVVGLL